MSKLEAVLFDLDGTLLDSAADLRQGLNLMLKDEGHAPVSLEQVKSFSGEGMMELTRRALAATGEVPEGDMFPYVQKFIAHYRKVKPDPQQIFPHVREVLEDFKKNNIKMGVCTNKSGDATIDILRQLGLLDYFGFVAGGDTFPVHKPNPGHVTGVIEALEVSPLGTVFVGDGPNDTVACFRAGIPCIVVTHDGTEFDHELDGAAQISGFHELTAAITGLGFEIG